MEGLESLGYVLGLDLGQRQDYTAAALVERLREPRDEPGDRERVRRLGVRGPHRTREPDEEPRPVHHHVRGLKRWPLGTSYVDIVRDVRALMGQPDVRGRTALVVDQTGVGIAVVNMFRDAGLPAVGYTITGGHHATPGTVPKKDLVGALQAGLERGTLKIASGLPLADALVSELQNFEVRVKLDTGHAQYAADWREGAHDDLVLALALAVHHAGRPSTGPSMDPADYVILRR